MSPDAADRTPIDPDAVAQHAFTKGRKGYDTDEVRAYLVGLASEIRDLQRVHDDLTRRLVEVERRAADPRELDEESVTQLLGEETARVLVDARKAATEIRTKADDEATAMREAAETEATEARAAAEQYAESVRTLADEGEARIRADAEAYSTTLRENADAETTAQRAEADAYAQEVRATADREVAEQRSAAQAEVDELTERARTVLDERTSEAEAAAATVRSDADAYDSRVRAEADEYAATTRTEADTYRDDTKADADRVREEAAAEAEQTRTEAEAAAAATIASGIAESNDKVAAATVEAERIVDDARDKGRGMVQEARDYRERVIADLAERRRAARDELDRIAKTRDALAVTLTDVVTQVERSHRSLQEIVIDPVSVSDGGADRRFLEVDESATSLGVGEVDGAVEADGDPVVAEDGSDAGKPDAEGGGENEDDGSGDAGEDATEPEAVVEVTEAGSIDDDDLDDEPPVWSDDVAEGEGNSSAEPADGDDGDDGDGGDDVDGGGGDPSTVDLADDDDESEVEGQDEDEPAAEDVVEDVEVGPDGEAGDDHVPADEEEDEVPTPPGIDDLFARIRAERDGSEPGPDDTAGDSADDAVDDTAVDTAVDGAGTEPGASSDVDAAADGEDPEKAGSPDDDLLDRRDATTDELERQLARRLKRVLSDEQNEALHDLRSVKGAPTAEAVLPSTEDHHDRYRQAVLEDLEAAERAGAAFYGEAPPRTADVSDIAEELASDLVRQVRGRLERSFEDSDDPDDVADEIRTLYREWKTQRIAEAARHFVLIAFARGVAEAAPDGSSFRWLVDHGGSAAPDCDDNALAGAVAKGEPFPTGDLCPPVHPGCRCLAVLVDSDT